MNAIPTKPKIAIPTANQPARGGGWLLFSIAICAILGIVALWKGVNFLDEDAEGNPILSAERQKKLDEALSELEEAEQYALLVVRPGYYPCFCCTNGDTIFLYKGETWKYGMTTKKEAGRYGSSLHGTGLAYSVQFIGTIQECLAEERRKIFLYATLPENIKRAKPLIRPPGNKIDR